MHLAAVKGGDERLATACWPRELASVGSSDWSPAGIRDLCQQGRRVVGSDSYFVCMHSTREKLLLVAHKKRATFWCGYACKL